MTVFTIISAVALFLGALMGAGALFSPRWAQGVVRLAPDPLKPGGFSEFRATYGGLFLMLHATALLILLRVELPMALLGVLPVAAAWIGAGLGRVFSLILDRQENRSPGLIPVWIPLELALGLAIAAPLLQIV